MANISEKPFIEVAVNLRLTESEARALEALVGYGFKPFLETFYKHLGEHYMRPHESGLRTLFESVKICIPPILHRVDLAREAFSQPAKERTEEA